MLLVLLLVFCLSLVEYPASIPASRAISRRVHPVCQPPLPPHVIILRLPEPAFLQRFKTTFRHTTDRQHQQKDFAIVFAFAVGFPQRRGFCSCLFANGSDVTRVVRDLKCGLLSRWRQRPTNQTFRSCKYTEYIQRAALNRGSPRGPWR